MYRLFGHYTLFPGFVISQFHIFNYVYTYLNLCKNTHVFILKILQILEFFVQDQKESIKMLAHQAGSLAEKTELMKTEVCNKLQEQKGNDNTNSVSHFYDTMVADHSSVLTISQDS